MSGARIGVPPSRASYFLRHAGKYAGGFSGSTASRPDSFRQVQVDLDEQENCP
jgi:hypothetical protein